MKKLGTMHAASSYFANRTSVSGDSRRSLIRRRSQHGEDKKVAHPSNKRQVTFLGGNPMEFHFHICVQVRKQSSIETVTPTKSCASESDGKKKYAGQSKPYRVYSTPTSDSDQSDSDANGTSQATRAKRSSSLSSPPPQKSSAVSGESIQMSAVDQASMKPIINIQKISHDIL